MSLVRSPSTENLTKWKPILGPIQEESEEEEKAIVTDAQNQHLKSLITSCEVMQNANKFAMVRLFTIHENILHASHPKRESTKTEAKLSDYIVNLLEATDYEMDRYYQLLENNFPTPTPTTTRFATDQTTKEQKEKLKRVRTLYDSLDIVTKIFDKIKKYFLEEGAGEDTSQIPSNYEEAAARLKKALWILKGDVISYHSELEAENFRRKQATSPLPARNRIVRVGRDRSEPSFQFRHLIFLSQTEDPEKARKVRQELAYLGNFS